MSRTSMIKCGLSLMVVCLVCWFFPLFHIRPLDGRRAESRYLAATPRQSGSADPVAYVREFWDGPLKAGDVGTDIAQLWNAFDADATGARSQYGRQAGLGGAWYFCVRGQGNVQTVEKDRVVLTVTGSSRNVCLELGVVVDNTVREAIGVKASGFANSQDFNAVSSELNRRAEQRVIASNRAIMKEGVVVDFVGCAKIGGKSDLDPLCLIPIQLQARASEEGNAGLNKEAPAGATP
ncbi:DUF2291 family protein [Novipirellula artificiosorum]|uniref:DUF2291 domain-containing protein n=1 Tax=Novipirellula artificiosorum TaxID=2528016 RepID=A0A5C6DZC3_9BACT|nr:DUF2291 family protein [Novipirellula artificiosorum]TWU41952.1 hypothetical protein Poly41_02480 [Novipirellula artificiosorum]